MIWDKAIDGIIAFTVGKVGRWWIDVNNEIDVFIIDAESRDIGQNVLVITAD